MNLLFLTLSDITNIEKPGIYTDLMREFLNNGHTVYIVSPLERNNHRGSYIIEQKECKILRIRTGNIKKANIIEKGISTLLIEWQYISGIRRYFNGIKFDLVLYSTPPVSFSGVVDYFKKRDNAKTYLVLKDIFPQNAVDIGIMCKTGVKGNLYRYFRNKEKRLYSISDRIGCMSEANVEYIIRHNPEIDPRKVEVCPNSIKIRDISLSPDKRAVIRQKYNIPLDKMIFVYGGNLGRPQDIPFIIECLKEESSNQNAYFLIVGNGTEYRKVEEFVSVFNPPNAKLIQRLPRDDYDMMIAACDVGLIFLDHQFTIPNFPSRLLSYMQAGLPVLACTDSNTDIGKVINEGKFGWWCKSDDVKYFLRTIDECMKIDISSMKTNSKQYLVDHYSVEKAYSIIMKYVMESC